MSNLLIVDDELGMRQFLTHLFQREGHEVRVAERGREAMTLLREEPVDLIISDVKMPDMSGIELLRSARELRPEVEVIMMTAFASVETAREAFLLGAYDFVQKPFDNDLLKEIVARALAKISLVKEKEALREENKVLIQGQRERGQLGNIIGRSPSMQALYQMIETVAQVQATVLVTGESGTGKELVARAIHDLGPRAEKPFVSINCGAFTETLLESELFGYVKGSFTGANSNRKGLFEAANTGTIFLDEIGEMSPAMQVKLLRVLQERKLRPVGATEETLVDTRVVAATNRDLAEMIRKGTFREDLFYRLNVIPLKLPPLRDRIDDLPELARFFLRRYNVKFRKNIQGIADSTLRMLGAYWWPGNIRELENLIERLVAVSDKEWISDEDLPHEFHVAQLDAACPASEKVLDRAVSTFERNFIIRALEKNGWQVTATAKALGIPLSTLKFKMDRLEIRELARKIRGK